MIFEDSNGTVLQLEQKEIVTNLANIWRILDMFSLKDKTSVIFGSLRHFKVIKGQRISLSVVMNLINVTRLNHMGYNYLKMSLEFVCQNQPISSMKYRHQRLYSLH